MSWRGTGEPVEQIENAFLPCVDRIVPLDQLKFADHTGPLEVAEHDVIGIGGPLPAKERLLCECHPHGLEAWAKGDRPLLPAVLVVLERAQLLFAILAPPSLVRRVEMHKRVPKKDAEVPGHRRLPPTEILDPGINEQCSGTADITSEQRWPVGVGVLEVAGDIPGIGDPLVTVDQNGNACLTAEGDRGAVPEVNRHALEIVETLVLEGHKGSPAIRAVADFAGSGQLVNRE